MMQPNFLPAVNAGKLGTVFGQVFLMQSNSPMYYLVTKFMKEATKKTYQLPSSVQYLLVFNAENLHGPSCNQIHLQIFSNIARNFYNKNCLFDAKIFESEEFTMKPFFVKLNYRKKVFLSLSKACCLSF